LAFILALVFASSTWIQLPINSARLHRFIELGWLVNFRFSL
jgi:hypothetical protein